MSSLAGYRVMVVEDSYMLAKELAAALGGAGAHVVGPFATGANALRSLRHDAPDCAVLDVSLGEGTSFDLARTLRMRGVPFLFVTGYDASALPAEFKDVVRLEKPVDATRLVQAVEACCQAAATPP